MEDWERTLCENKAVAILEQMQAGRPARIQKDGEEMLIAMVLDRPLAEAKSLVEDPTAFLQEMTKVLVEKQNHPVLKQMFQTAQSEDPPPAGGATSSTDTLNRSNASRPVQFQ